MLDSISSTEAPPVSRADAVIEFIEIHCRTPEGANVGQPITLDDFQKRFIRDVYRPGVRRALLSVARKNGKTTLIAGIVLAHICGPEAKLNAQIVSGAMSQDQAALVYDAVVKMIDLNPILAGATVVRRQPKSVRGLGKNTLYWPLAAEAKTAHGLSPVLAVLDEIGQLRAENDPFIDAIVTSQGAHADPLLIVISTQADSDKALFSKWIDDALDEDNDDPSIVCHLYAADDDCDIADEDQWHKANPGLGRINFAESIRAEARMVARSGGSESSFRNYYLNQRVETFDPYIQRSDWLACGDEAGEAGVWFGGLDLSTTTDLTAYVRVGWNDSGKLAVVPRFFVPGDNIIQRGQLDGAPYEHWAKLGQLETHPGSSISYELVAAMVLDDMRNGRLQRVAYDPWRFTEVLVEMQTQGATKSELARCEAMRQGFKTMAPALNKLDTYLVNGRLAHGNHPVLDMCARNAVVVRDSADNRKLDKIVSNRRIDGIVALTMAVAICTKEPPKKSVYADPAALRDAGLL